MTLQQITHQTETGTEWITNLEEFETPDALIEWLEAAADPTEYRVEGHSVWATDAALDAAVAALDAAITEQQS